MHSHNRMLARRTIIFFSFFFKRPCPSFDRKQSAQWQQNVQSFSQNLLFRFKCTFLTSMQVRWEVLVVNTFCNRIVVRNGARDMGSIVQLPNHSKIFYCSIWSTSSKDSKTLAWLMRSKKCMISFLVGTDQSFILQSIRGGEPSAQQRDESLQDGTAVEGRAECCREQFEPSDGLGRGGAWSGGTPCLSPPSQSPLWTSWPSADLQCWLWDGWWTESAACPTAKGAEIQVVVLLFFLYSSSPSAS